MDDHFIEKKIDKLDTIVKRLLQKEFVGYDDIHSLRTLSREILSLISKESELYNTIKKIIKLSNHIRDLDVFKYDFLESLQQHYKNSIDLKLLHEEISIQRDADLATLVLYLGELILNSSQHAHTSQNNTTHHHIKKPPLKFGRKNLHKYRIYVKTKLYIFKNRYPYEKAAIRRYMFLKDSLGDINDNFNALSIIESFDLDEQSYKLIKEYVISENQRLFKLIKKLA